MNMRLNPLITLQGKAQEAIDFYVEVFGAEVLFMQRYGEGTDLPNSGGEGQALIAHSVLKAGESELIVMDAPPGEKAQAGEAVSVLLTVTDVETGQRVYDALSADGTQILPFQEVHFSPGYGMVRDRFGVTFHVNANASLGAWSQG